MITLQFFEDKELYQDPERFLILQDSLRKAKVIHNIKYNAYLIEKLKGGGIHRISEI